MPTDRVSAELLISVGALSWATLVVLAVLAFKAATRKPPPPPATGGPKGRQGTASQVFSAMDMDGDGMIDKTELAESLKMQGLDYSQAAVEKLWSNLDR